MDEMYGRFNLKPFLCGNSGPQWAGWFRNEINSLDDLRGLRYRTTGLNSVVMSRLGRRGRGDVRPGHVPGPANRARWMRASSSALDRFDAGLPAGRRLLLRQRRRRAFLCGKNAAVNLDSWNSLPDDLKQAVGFAAESLYNPVLTEYNTNHARALRELVAGGTQVMSWPEEIIVAMGNTMGEVLDEMLEDDDELVRRITESFLDYRNLMVDYMAHSEAAQLAARNLDFTYGGSGR